CVVVRPGSDITKDTLIRCRESLANYKAPRHVEFLSEELPKSASVRKGVEAALARAILGGCRAGRRVALFDHSYVFVGVTALDTNTSTRVSRLQPQFRRNCVTECRGGRNGV